MQSEAMENAFTYMLVEKARHGRFLVNPNDTYIGRMRVKHARLLILCRPWLRRVERRHGFAEQFMFRKLSRG